MKVISVTGLSGSGKTGVIEQIIKELKARGYTVGSVKEIHFEAFRLDQEGKNTWRHRQAGADTVTARAHHETDIMYKGHLPIYEVLSHYNQDFVVLEGVRDAVVPEIAVCKEDETPALTPLTIAISGRFANNRSGAYNGLPIFNALTDASALADYIIQKTPDLMPDFDPDCCSFCGSDCRGFLARYLKGEKKLSDCVINTQNVALKIDGKDIALVPFVQNILRNTVLGVVSELKGYKKDARICIEFDNKESKPCKLF